MIEKVYIDVVAKFDSLGKITPLSITWTNQHQYQIDKILDIRKAASLKAGGIGTRYTCVILGKPRFLYYENPKWFVECKS